MKTQLEHSATADKKPTNLTTSRAATQTRSDQPVTTGVYSRPLVDGRHGVRENGNLETVHHQIPPIVHSETHEPRYANHLYAT